MKSTSVLVSVLLLSIVSVSRAVVSNAVTSKDRTISRVVKLLEDMLEKSKEDGDEERTLYGKFKCYCDTNEADKKKSIESLTTEIGLLESDIEGLRASSAKHSQESARLTAAMAENEASRAKAQSIRDKEKDSFDAMEADSTAAIGQMTDAIDTLAAVGADQSLKENAAADHERFMKGSGASLLKLSGAVRQALLAAGSFTTKGQIQVVESFLQAPFTGTYTAQSGEVVGILKDMRDTFTSNLASARAAEAAPVEAHEKYMETMEAEHTQMDESNEEKQDALSGNDEDLATKTQQLSTAKSTKADDESFLASLLDMCAAKAKDYEDRTLLRKNEDAALAEAISILNSDAAFQTFGEVSATKTGATGFLQRSAVRRHAPSSSADSSRDAAQQLLLRVAAEGHGSSMLTRVAALLEANNPFSVVLEDIKKIVALIAEEEKADKEKFTWCESERNAKNDDLSEKVSQIVSLNADISTLDSDINSPQTGIKAQISSTETALEQNRQSQATETQTRKEENVAYTKDVAHLVEAEKLVANAISVLEKYYSKILKASEGGAAFVQQPAPPDTWEGSYAGQSAKGTDAIGMLKFILEETKKEEAAAHKDEADGQHAFEDSMQALKTEEADKMESLASLNKLLAEKKQLLLEKTSDLKATEADKAAIEAYLLKIKPGCDFIVTNIDKRKQNRAKETSALNSATKMLKGTPAYQAAVAAAHQEGLGECQEICAPSEEHVDCKACLAKVTVPAYCAGHAGTKGC